MAKAELRESMNALDRLANPTKHGRAVEIEEIWEILKGNGVVPNATDRENTAKYVAGKLEISDLFALISSEHPDLQPTEKSLALFDKK
ncbi:MAG: hypothetical protein KDI68_16145 [Gammaproteobacteria bacterium]|nr:hypothetical protein [Gammaproteobacteria bacterium]